MGRFSLLQARLVYTISIVMLSTVCNGALLRGIEEVNCHSLMLTVCSAILPGVNCGQLLLKSSSYFHYSTLWQRTTFSVLLTEHSSCPCTQNVFL